MLLAALLVLGVDEDTFLRRIADALGPGGKFLIYNICPPQAPPSKPYIPWADGQSPFSRQAFEKVGLRVVVFDQSDDAAIAVMAKAYGWELPLFAWWTLVEKP